MEKAIFNYGDAVEFVLTFEDAKTLIQGKVSIVDAYGTFFNFDEPCYDIQSFDTGTLYKHVPQSCISLIEK